MTKIVIVIFVLFSQATFAQGVRFGFKVGANLSSIKGDFGSDFETSSKLGFHGGIFIDIPVEGVFSLQPEFYYSQKGYNSDTRFFGEIIHNLNYLDVPLLAKFTFKSGSGFYFGPQLSFLLTSRVKQPGFPDDVSTEGLSSTNVALCFGIHQRVSSVVEIGARYNLGISNVMETDPGFDLTSPDRVFQLYLSFAITGNKKERRG